MTVRRKEPHVTKAECARAIMDVLKTKRSGHIIGWDATFKAVKPYLNLHPSDKVINKRSGKPWWQQTVKNVHKPSKKENQPTLLARGELIAIYNGGFSLPGKLPPNVRIIDIKQIDDLTRKTFVAPKARAAKAQATKAKPALERHKFDHALPGPYKRELLYHLIEECAEVQQRATKILRFGATEIEPGQASDNGKRLSREFGQLNLVVELCIDVGLIGVAGMAEGHNEKFKKIAKYMQFQAEADE